MPHIIKIQDAFSFIPREELNLLEALESQNIEVEYQCREGFCGSCQVQLIEGEVEYDSEPIAFIPDGKILPCCCRAQTDLTIHIPDSCHITKV
ncbi:(Fe-S)-binding protein [Endozoicomonas sp. (ex Bugula neritina AB1)]|nr:(Fe-S)-binding protein [Endozoicomonas sp. (ex Bugula neritina AB1)]